MRNGERVMENLTVKRLVWVDSSISEGRVCEVDECI